jgi:Putative peptidoglycan binding domain
MRAHFSPMQRLISCVLISLLAMSGFAADKKKKTEPESKSKTPAKAELKSQAKNSAEKKPDPKKEKPEKAKPQVAKNKKDSEADKKSLKSKSDLVAERSSKKPIQPAPKTASRQSEPKSKPTKDELAAKKEKAEKKNTREEKSKEKLKEVVAVVEKKPLKSEKPDIVKPIKKPRETFFEESFRESTAVKELPRAGKFQFRPVVKISPKVQLNFGLSSVLAAAAYEPPPPVTSVDIIEVYESGSAETQVLEEIRRQEIARLSTNPIPNVSNKKIDLKKMDQERISQIQEALFKRGYFVGEPTGNYDELTVQAMRKFQQDHRVDVTGYPTAQSLKLLGLVDYEPRFE